MEQSSARQPPFLFHRPLRKKTENLAAYSLRGASAGPERSASEQRRAWRVGRGWADTSIHTSLRLFLGLKGKADPEVAFWGTLTTDRDRAMPGGCVPSARTTMALLTLAIYL
ncbi:hypothetical protein NDU88_001109 [Pleurodeles waltl]|uniref:Uncharacterized protein n=1 Tax=Pleurodeles waltl TaxID=8319 RepID=A0AAV7U7H3_PLEWA|nr:hypothetical protein NDU88_001109 [Pleurodeles waltl]